MIHTKHLLWLILRLLAGLTTLLRSRGTRTVLAENLLLKRQLLVMQRSRFGCPKIAQHLAKAFGSAINMDVVRRVLAAHYRPERRDSGPSWLTFLGHAKENALDTCPQEPKTAAS